MLFLHIDKVIDKEKGYFDDDYYSTIYINYRGKVEFTLFTKDKINYIVNNVIRIRQYNKKIFLNKKTEDEYIDKKPYSYKLLEYDLF